MNWKAPKLSCFTLCGWLGDYVDLVCMERATNLLLGFDKGLLCHWGIE